MDQLKKILRGIPVATSVSKSMFQTTQEVVQADGAHTSFGKYTLFSTYTTAANGNMANVAFAILFGNEDIKNWTLFWNFATKVHPIINLPQVTLMTDQDKGSITVRACIPQAFNFHCSYHRRENINKYCGGGKKGTKPLMAMWLFCRLSACSNMRQLKAEKTTYLDQLHPTNRHYLTTIPDEKQYPAAQCAMAQDICMYGKSASLGVESMNRANKIVREKTAVDVLNAAILLLQMEGNRFHQWKEKAWGRELPLTPKGMEHMEMVFKDVNVCEYRLTTHEDMFWHYATISKNTEKMREYHVRLPKESYNGSYFGKCTCGVTSKEGIPCRHMVVLVKSSVIPTLTQTNIMPHFWSTAHWQMQYPLDLDCNTKMTIQMVKAVS